MLGRYVFIVLPAISCAFASAALVNRLDEPLVKRSSTPNNTYGGTVNGFTCDPTSPNGGPCCSSAGFCGSTSQYCSAGCQWAFSDPGCSFSPQNTCGGAQGFTCKPDNPGGGPCCSSAGFCGITNAYCGAGCNPAYGSCFGTSAPAIHKGNTYEVPGVGVFTKTKEFTFTTDGELPTGMGISTDTIHTTPLSHKFTAANVDVSDGFLTLTVPGGQKKAPILCAEVFTDEDHIFYGSVRTYAIFSKVPGTVHGNFFFKSDSQEIDIEYVTSPNSRSNPGNGKRVLQYTNQALDGNPAHESHKTSPSPPDVTTAVHEYRTDWLKDGTRFYLDGVLQRTISTNVPTKPGPWLWNNWSSGDINFTVGPPLEDNIFKIQHIVMYYNVSMA